MGKYNIYDPLVGAYREIDVNEEKIERYIKTAKKIIKEHEEKKGEQNGK